MTDLEHLLPLWTELEQAQADYVLATVVGVEGSSYRRPGARMLLAPDGRRAGTVSGGCLEAEVARRAWWLTEGGPRVERYSTIDDDGDLPFGSGCGGVVSILQERSTTARGLLTALKWAFDARGPLAIATVLEGPQAGRRAYAGATQDSVDDPQSADDAQLTQLARAALEQRASLDAHVRIDGADTAVWIDYRAPRPALWIFGAGDDARSLAVQARHLGWYVAVADGRRHLATRPRFSAADAVIALDVQDFPAAPCNRLDLKPGDAAVVMTHSFEQDSRFLAWLMRDWHQRALAYAGVLGPQRRTWELLAQARRYLNLPTTGARDEEWMERLHAPMGLDLGAETPASIALSVLAEVQKVRTSASALPLREVRASAPVQTT